MKADLNELVNAAARDLPEGYELIIRIEQNSGVVVLEDPFGDDVDFASNHETIAEEVRDALQFAIEHDKEYHSKYFED